MSKKLKQKKGFTIIEVVLVLAIAGLIFLMVFVVIPQAMAGQRDGERRQAMARVQEQLIQYQTNNKSKHNNLPDNSAWAGTEKFESSCSNNSACSFVKNYLNPGSTDDENTFYDPDGVPYNVVITCNMATSNCGTLTPTTVATAGEGGSYTGDYSILKSTSNGWSIEGNNPVKAHTIFIIPGGQCSGESVVKSELRHFAVLYRLEGSGVYCGDSD